MANLEAEYFQIATLLEKDIIKMVRCDGFQCGKNLKHLEI